MNTQSKYLLAENEKDMVIRETGFFMTVGQENQYGAYCFL